MASRRTLFRNINAARRLNFNSPRLGNRNYAGLFMPDNTIIANLKMLANPAMSTTFWFIVLDTSDLLKEYEFIKSFVQTESTCRLMITFAVRLEIEKIAVGRETLQNVPDCMKLAQKIARDLIFEPSCIFFQPEMDKKDFTVDAPAHDILNCCLYFKCQNKHVIFLSDNLELLRRASQTQLIYFRLKDIKTMSSYENVRL